MAFSLGPGRDLRDLFIGRVKAVALALSDMADAQVPGEEGHAANLAQRRPIGHPLRVRESRRMVDLRLTFDLCAASAALVR